MLTTSFQKATKIPEVIRPMRYFLNALIAILVLSTVVACTNAHSEEDKDSIQAKPTGDELVKNEANELATIQPISKGIMKSVFHIATASGNTGTALVCRAEGFQFVITAEHVVNDVEKGDLLKFFYLEGPSKGWIDLEVTFRSAAPDIDCAILQVSKNFPDLGKFTLGVPELYVSQPCYLLGYPRGLIGATLEDSSFPMPLVKRGIISGIADPDKWGPGRIIVDIRSVPGFSGGPIVCIDENGKQCVVGIQSQSLYYGDIQDPSKFKEELDFSMAVKTTELAKELKRLIDVSKAKLESSSDPVD